MKKGFSLLEVLFAIAFLTMVGVAIAVLNSATLRLTTQAEIQTTANSLSDELIGFLKANYYVDKNGFDNFIANCTTGSCYFTCSNSQIDQNCSFSTSEKSQTIGRSRLAFKRAFNVQKKDNTYQVRVKVSWGDGVSNRLELEHTLQ